MTYKENLHKVVDFIKAKGFTEDFESIEEEMEDEETQLTFSTREHGDVGACEVGEQDVQALRELLKEIQTYQPFLAIEGKIGGEFVDEWVMVNLINLSPENY